MKPAPGRDWIMVNMPIEGKQALEEIAQSQRTNVAELTRHIIREYLAEQGKEIDLTVPKRGRKKKSA